MKQTKLAEFLGLDSQLDSNTPIWQEQPKLIRKVYNSFGCGPEAKGIFSFSYLDKSRVLIKAIVKNMHTGNVFVCYITKKDDLFELGHHMCWGEFKFEKEGEKDNDKYEVSFNLIDESGNLSAQSKSNFYST